MSGLLVGAALLLMATASGNLDAPLFGSKEGADFIRAMDEAVRKEKAQKELTNRLLSRATFRQPPTATRDLANDDGLEIDLTQYALKYVGCSAVNTWSDDVAEDADAGTVFALDQFVMFRLCPADYCGSYGHYGCQDSYGEYLITMEDYLQIMADYHFDRFQEYCETCAECMSYGDDDDDGNANANADDKYGDDGYGGYNNGDDGYVGYNAYAGDDAYSAYDNTTNDDDTFVPECQYYDACKNYQYACRYYESLQYADHEDYFQCAQFKNNDEIAYLGPHCNSDGVTITIGVYEDEYCSSYIGDSVDIESFTGMDLNDGFSEFFSSPSCVSCLSKNTYQLYGGDDDQARAGDEVYDLCYWLYTYAAKCNVHLDDANTFDSSEQAENEEMVCEFIKSLVSKTYDEYGEIVLASEGFEISNWKDAHEYQKLQYEVTGFQGFMLAFSILLFLSLLVYSCYLHRKITAPLRRRNRAYPHQQSVGWNTRPGDTLSRRAQSGITRDRSIDYNAGAWA